MTEMTFSPNSFGLLENLRANTTRAWHAEFRAALKDHLRQPFENLIVATSVWLKDCEFAMSGEAQTMFLQNRDALQQRPRWLWAEISERLLSLVCETSERRRSLGTGVIPVY
jgi:uncharacterized protein (DUF2461 family)